MPNSKLQHSIIVLLLSILVSHSPIAVLSLKPEPTTWKHHPILPLLSSTPLPPLLRTWHHTTDDPDHGANSISLGYSLYKPRSSPYKSPFRNHDMLITTWKSNDRSDYLTLTMNRKSKCYLIVDRGFNNENDLQGWKSIKTDNDVAILQNGIDEEINVMTGRIRGHVRRTKIPKRGKVFMRMLKEGDNLIKDPRKNGAKYHVFLFAEADGTITKEPVYLKGKKAPKVGSDCPKELHDLWVTEKGDDKSVQDMKFKTWHPQYDPIYWCYYRHEHGSDPRIMGYKQTMDYTAYKNGKEDESEIGFKNYVFEKNKYWFFISLHVHISQKRRFTERFHTTVFAVTDKSGDLKAEFSCKGDFGPAVTHGTRSRFDRLPLNEINEKMEQELRDKKDFMRKRVFNVDSPGNRPKLVEYNSDNSSHYEEWINGIAETCTSAPDKLTNKNNRLNNDKLPRFIIDIRDPITAQARLGNDDTPSYLSDYPNEINVGIARTVLQEGEFYVGEKYCKFENGRFKDYASKTGIFYTDPYCKKLLNGPGPNAVRQFIEPGFLVKLPIINQKRPKSYKDNFDTKNPWTNEFEVTPQNMAGTRERFFVPQLNLGAKIDYHIN